MEAPLALHAQAEPELPSDEPQPLPRELREELRRWMLVGVAGPFAPAKREEQRWRVRACEAFTLAWLWCTAYTFYRAVQPLASAAALAISAAIVAIALISTLMAATGSGGQYFQWNNLLPRVLEQLEGPVGPETAAALQGLAKGATRKTFITLPLTAAMCIAIVCESDPDAAHQYAAAVVYVLGQFFLMVSAPGKEMIDHAIWALTEDKQEQLRKRIRGTTAATANFDELTDGVYRAHLATTELSKVMGSHVVFSVALAAIASASCIVASVAPRPPQSYYCAPTWASNSTAAPMEPGCPWYDVVGQYGLGSWYNLFCHQFVLVFWTLFFSAQGVALLFAPARVTTACQKVASAVNDLRVNAVDDQPAKLATLEQGQRIEILKRYISELNRDQGLGVLILKKRITFTLVMGMLIQTVSAMVVINTTLQSVLHDTEEEIAAVTAEESVIEAAEAALTGKG